MIDIVQLKDLQDAKDYANYVRDDQDFAKDSTSPTKIGLKSKLQASNRNLGDDLAAPYDS